jgi:hypothetical protein
MMTGPIRRLANIVGGLLGHVYPASLASWARAMRCEVDQVEDDRAALRFALGCLWGGCRQAAAERISSAAKGFAAMIASFGKLGEPRNVGIGCALAATGFGIVYLLAAGAPVRYSVVNAVAFLLGLMALRGIAGAASSIGRSASLAVLVLGACLLATALFGASADGVSRWIWIGPLSVQLSLVVLPLMIVAFARRPDAVGAFGIAAAALALALQPDRAMAGVLALAMAALAAASPGRPSAAPAFAAVAAFALSLARPDSLPAVPYVDRILFTAFDVHPLAGAAIVLGSLLLPVPALAGWRVDPARRGVYLAFAATWLGCVLAAAVGNYPTPVVGYGGSAILGYLLSLSMLPAGVGSARRLAAGAARGDRDCVPGSNGRDRLRTGSDPLGINTVTASIR